MPKEKTIYQIKYCLYFGGRRRGKVKCLAEECVCKEEIEVARRKERRFTLNGS